MEILNALGDFFGSVLSWTAEEWQAVATVGTLVVAVVAAIVALAQVRQAAALRREQSRPYVVAYLELTGESTLYLVVKNFGATAARDITMTSDVPLTRVWGDEVEPLATFDVLPILVPGQDWRTLFDLHGQRSNDRTAYRVTIKSRDSHRKPLPDESFVLDWTPYETTQYVGRKTLHDVGESLKEIERAVKSWGEGTRGLAVVARDGDAKDKRTHAEMERRRAERQARADAATVETAPPLPEPVAQTRKRDSRAKKPKSGTT